MKDEQRVAIRMQELLASQGVNVSVDVLVMALEAGLRNGPTYTYNGEVKQFAYVLYVP